MYFQNINTYTNPAIRNTERSSDVNTSNSRSSRNKGNQQKACGLPSQNNDFLAALMQMVQNLLKQLQPKQDTPQGVKLSDSQRQNIATTLGVNPESINVVDADKDGTVSAGDQIKATFTTDTGGTESLSRTVDAGFALDINGKLGTPLDMNTVGLTEQITKHLGIANGRFHDQDASGSLSAGDIIKSVSYDPGGQGTPRYHTLTTGDMQSLRDAGIYPPTTKGQPLTLSEQQKANIISDMYNINPTTVSILDQDGSGTVSEGDLFKTSYRPLGIGTDPIVSIERSLSLNEAKVINGEFGSRLTLDDANAQRVSDALNIIGEAMQPFGMSASGTVLDADHSGTLSDGDLALSYVPGASGGLDTPPRFPDSYVALSVAPDGAVSVQNSSNFLPLSDQQRANIKAGIFNINADNAFIVDKDSSGTVSKGDVLKTRYGGFGGDPTVLLPLNYNMTLGENEADLINGELGTSLTLNDTDKARLRNDLDTPSTAFYRVLDRDDSGTLSSGDVALGSHAGSFGGYPPPSFPTSYVSVAVAADGSISAISE